MKTHDTISNQVIVHLLSENDLPALLTKQTLTAAMSRGNVTAFGQRAMASSELSPNFPSRVRNLSSGYVFAFTAADPSAGLIELIGKLVGVFGIEHVSDIKPWRSPRGYLCSTIIVQQKG